MIDVPPVQLLRSAKMKWLESVKFFSYSNLNVGIKQAVRSWEHVSFGLSVVS